jgi:hypothetical protein
MPVTHDHPNSINILARMAEGHRIPIAVLKDERVGVTA